MMRIPRLMVLCGAVVTCLLLVLPLAGCGQQTGEKAVEQMLEKALEGENADIDVDIEGGESGSISISGKDGDASFSVGGAANVPADFPKGLLPGDAEVVAAMEMTEGDGVVQSVTFKSKKGVDEMYDWFLNALPGAGYTVENKMEYESNGAKGFTIGASDGDCSATGVEQDGEFVYSVIVSTN